MSDSSESVSLSAAGILLITRTRPRQFLLMRHVDRWDLPKGHCDPGESSKQTALRETEEETGIDRASIVLAPDFRFELSYLFRYKKSGNQAFQKTVVYLLGEIESAFTPTLTEHESFRWFDWKPPHKIQSQTIDPLLEAVALYIAQSKRSVDS